MQYSITLTGIIVMVAGTLLVNMGFTEECAGQITEYIPLLVGAAISWYGRVRGGDVTPLGFRK